MAWTAETTEDTEKTEEKKVQRSIFSTRIFWQLHCTTKDTLFCTRKVSVAHTEQKNRQCAYHIVTAGYTHVHPHSQPCHRSSQADPTAYSQASVCPARASHCRLPYWAQMLTTPIKWWYNAVISETQVGMKKRLSQHVSPQGCKTRVSSWQGHTLSQLDCLEIHSSDDKVAYGWNLPQVTWIIKIIP